LPGTQGELLLLHQDLHGENVLAAQREPWLVIDPKPLLGEREFGVAPIVRSFELGHSRRDVLYRFDRLTAELGLDRERARGWTIAQTLAWTFDSDYRRRHLETASWLLEAA
jgi:streptomycin 6-kinase